MEFTSMGKEITAEDCANHIPEGYEVTGYSLSTTTLQTDIGMIGVNPIDTCFETTEYKVRLELIKGGIL
jgi:hypothetical protein